MTSASDPSSDKVFKKVKMNVSLSAPVEFPPKKGKTVSSISESPFLSPTRLDIVIKLFREEHISLGTAVNLCDLQYSEMIRRIRDQGINLRFGPKNKEEALKEEEILKKYIKEQSTSHA